MPYFSDNEHFSSVMTGLGGGLALPDFSWVTGNHEKITAVYCWSSEIYC